MNVYRIERRGFEVHRGLQQRQLRGYVYVRTHGVLPGVRAKVVQKFPDPSSKKVRVVGRKERKYESVHQKALLMVPALVVVLELGSGREDL